MRYGQNSGYGRSWFDGLKTKVASMGKMYFVAASTDPNYQMIQELLTPDADGVARLYANITDALAACNTNGGDVIMLSPAFTTAPTLTELATASTKGVMIEQAGGRLGDAFVTQRATGSLPATGNSPIFTVTAPIRLLDIQGEVTTAIQNQACSILLAAIPTVGSSVNIATNVQVQADTVGTTYNITGTLATAVAKNANGVLVSQAAPITIPAGAIHLVTTATNTGAVKWVVRYQPLVPGARVFAA